MSQVAKTVKTYILESFLVGESSDQLDHTTPLISGGILDSISTLKLVAFIEESFNIEIEAHEMGENNFGSIAAIVDLIEAKSKAD